MKGLTYDTGALIAYEDRDPTMTAIHRSAVDHNIKPMAPAGVPARV